jgi:hypothetical protein
MIADVSEHRAPKIITELADMDAEDLCFKTQKEELELLATVLAEGDEAGLEEVFEGLNGGGGGGNKADDLDVDELFSQQSQARPAARRTQGSFAPSLFLSSLSRTSGWH